MTQHPQTRAEVAGTGLPLMRAVVRDHFGPPEVLGLREVPEPVVGPAQVKVRVRATSINAIDVIMRSGAPKGRLLAGMFRPRHPILGFDFAGEVAALGERVSDHRVGDRVVGISPAAGANAEYVCVEPREMAPLPAEVGYVEAAALAAAGNVALLFLQAIDGIGEGRRVLVVGASGGIGTLAVQLAHHHGAHVTGVCSTANVELVRSLGAEEVIDYTREDPTARRASYDVVFDTVAAGSFRRYRPTLRPGGVYSTTVATPGILAAMAFNPLRRSRRRAHYMFAKGTPRDDLPPLIDLARQGTLRPVIQETLPLEQAAEAHRHYETGHTRGKIVLTV